MAMSVQETDTENTDTYVNNKGTVHHDPDVNKLLRSKNEQLASLELPERLLVPSKDNFGRNNQSNTSVEPAQKVISAEIIRREEEEKEAVAEDHGEIIEDFFTREREISSSLPDNHEPFAGPTNDKERLPNYKPTLILRSHTRGVAAVKFSPDGRKIASCSADGTVKTWDAQTGSLEHTFEAHLAGVSTIAWSPNSDVLASGSDDKTIRLWHTSTGKAHPVPFIGHHNYIYSLAFSPKGNMIVSGSYDETIFIWDVRTARILRSLPAHSDPVGGVDFVRDGTLIVSCSSDGLIRIWDTATGQCLRTLIHEDNVPVVAVRFSPNGKYVLAWTLDNCLRLWNYVEGRCVKTYQGHCNVKYSLTGAFGTYGEQAVEYKRDPFGNFPNKYAFIVSGSEDNKIFLWDVSSKETLQRLTGHTDTVLGVDAHPTEQAIVSCSLDRTIRIWRDNGFDAKCKQVI